MKVALVLGGGGSRGLAHVGVLQVLQQIELQPDLIVATSMGGVVGVLYGLGFGPEEISHGFRLVQNGLTFNVRLLSARARQRRVRDNLAALLGNLTFADLHLPVTLMTVDMEAGVEVPLSEGRLLPAVLASSAVPGAFPPVWHRGRHLADGGVIDSLCTPMAYTLGADKVIAVDVHPTLAREAPWDNPLRVITGLRLPFDHLLGAPESTRPTLPAALWRANRVMTWYVHEQRLQAHPAHVLLRPQISHFGSLDFKDVHGPVAAGVAVAEENLTRLQAIKAARDEARSS